jgi:hypothetical protein
MVGRQNLLGLEPDHFLVKQWGWNGSAAAFRTCPHGDRDPAAPPFFKTRFKARAGIATSENNIIILP